jgi:hypothetical protein
MNLFLILVSKTGYNGAVLTREDAELLLHSLHSPNSSSGVNGVIAVLT